MTIHPDGPDTDCLRSTYVVVSGIANMNDLLRVCVRLRKDPLIEFRLRLLYLILLGKNRKSK